MSVDVFHLISSLTITVKQGLPNSAVLDPPKLSSDAHHMSPDHLDSHFRSVCTSQSQSKQETLHQMPLSHVLQEVVEYLIA